MAPRDGKKYASPYVYHQSMQTWHGCPACAPVIQETLKAIKNKHVAEGVKQWQAEAMTLEDLAQVMQWSEATVKVTFGCTRVALVKHQPQDNLGLLSP